MMSFFGRYLSNRVLTYCCPKDPVPPVMRMDLSLNIIFGRYLSRSCSELRHSMKGGTALQQFIVGALGFDPALREFHDAVATLDGRQPMSNEQHREIPVEPLDGIHDRPFRFIVEGARGLIENEDARLFVQRSSDADALPLAAGEPNPALADEGIISLRPALDEFGDLSLARRVAHPLEIDLVARHAKGDVFSQ